MITLWNPVTQAFEANTGTPPVSEPVLLLNILIELRAQNFILSMMNQDVLKDDVGSIRADMANDTSNFVTGPGGPLTS